MITWTQSGIYICSFVTAVVEKRFYAIAFDMVICKFLTYIYNKFWVRLCVTFYCTVKPRFNGQMRTNDSPLLEKVR